MPDRFQTDALDAQAPDRVGQCPPLPSWLAARLLREGETVTWVVGPRFNPSWERYVTHPLLFVVALVLGVVCVAIERSMIDKWSQMSALSFVVAGGLVLGSIFVLGFFSGYFTRLVVTNARLFIIQGYEVCRSWKIDALPMSLLRYRSADGLSEEIPTIDLDALKSMLGDTSGGKFVEAKTILEFGKQIARIKARENRRS